VRLYIGLVALGLAVSLALLGLGALIRLEPGPIAAVVLGLLILLSGVWVLRALGRQRPGPYEGPPEEVTELDVYFVCGECGTELRVERIGELQVPRHCGEKMLVERRPARPSLN
jgi:DNA-directed RNA polymerase subunit RPC12/RpoP